MTVQVYLKGEMIERGTGKPGFRWVQGYYGINPDNGHKFYPPVTRREAFAMAKRDGEKALFFDTEQQIDEWVNKTNPKGTLTMIEIAYTAPDHFGVLGEVGAVRTMWLTPTRCDVIRAVWYASQGVPQFDGYEQTLFDLLMAGF